MITRALRRLTQNKLARDEDGHAAPALGNIAGAAGAIILAVGAASSEDAITIVGGVLLAVGIFAGGLLGHMTVDYPVYERLNKLEGKDGD